MQHVKRRSNNRCSSHTSIASTIQATAEPLARFAIGIQDQEAPDQGFDKRFERAHRLRGARARLTRMKETAVDSESRRAGGKKEQAVVPAHRGRIKYSRSK
jgi:hypothetical protein